MPHTVRRGAHRKAKKSFTLSAESVEFLETMRKKRQALSVSSVLDEILLAVRRSQAKAGVERAVADYYAALSPEERQEQSDWGEFAEREFPKAGA
jgi:hypothetical protein